MEHTTHFQRSQRARRTAVFVAALAFLTILGPATSQASVSVALSVPGSFQIGYATPVIVAPVGGPLIHVSTDVPPHNLIAFQEFGEDGRPWCEDTPAGQCPLFWSDLLNLGGSAFVQGLEYTERGQMYDFYCSVHPNRQRGILIVV